MTTAMMMMQNQNDDDDEDEDDDGNNGDDDKGQQIFIISHGEKLLVAHVERLLWSRRGSNPVPFGLQSDALSTKLSCPPGRW
jgi:hypothetical protein